MQGMLETRGILRFQNRSIPNVDLTGDRNTIAGGAIGIWI